MKRFDRNIYRLKYVRLYIACRNLTISVVQRHNFSAKA